MKKHSLDEIKGKMRKLLEDAVHNEDKEPQSIGDPENIFDNKDNEVEEAGPAFTDKWIMVSGGQRGWIILWPKEFSVL